MLRDLLAHHLDGTVSRAAVIDLLGRPDEKDAAEQNGGSYWRWGLGSGGTRTSCHSLLLHLVDGRIYSITTGHFGG